LGESNQKENERHEDLHDMEVTFSTGGENTTEQKEVSNDEATPWEKYLQKVAEKKKDKKDRKRKRKDEGNNAKSKEEKPKGTLVSGMKEKKKKMKIDEEEKKRAEELELLLMSESLHSQPKKGFNLDRLVSEATEADEELVKKKKMPMKKNKRGITQVWYLYYLI
jgi:hypothetical protein